MLMTVPSNVSRAANAVGIPSGVTVFCDLEGIANTDPPVSHSVISEYCNNWYAAVDYGGFVPVLYVAYYSYLTDAELSALSFGVFWKSGRVSTPTDGYQMVQTSSNVIKAGVKIDEDTVQSDPGSLTFCASS